MAIRFIVDGLSREFKTNLDLFPRLVRRRNWAVIEIDGKEMFHILSETDGEFGIYSFVKTGVEGHLKGLTPRDEMAARRMRNIFKFLTDISSTPRIFLRPIIVRLEDFDENQLDL